MKNRTPYRFVIAGGGTGGHLYPALAVAQQIRSLKPESEILFVGAKNKIEARIVPEYGFDFKSIWVSGFSRKLTVYNLLFPLKLIVSLIQSFIINFNFKPRVAIGSGAYVSGPVVWAASVFGARVILLEQNSYPGLTNRMLEKKADEIHLTFEESKKYFRYESKLKVTGNPIRINLIITDRAAAKKSFGLEQNKKTLLVIGGSGGARSINKTIANKINEITSKGIQIIWQTGQFYFEEFKKYESDLVKVVSFIKDMPTAYSACDLLLARAGATTIAEAAALGVPALFVPSENVAANHQLKNVKSLMDIDAAEMIQDKDLDNVFVEKVSQIIFDENRLNELKKNISGFAKPMAAKTVAETAIKLAEII